MDPALYGDYLTPTSRIRVSTILISLTIGDHKLRGEGGLQWRNVHINFRENRSVEKCLKTCIYFYEPLPNLI